MKRRVPAIAASALAAAMALTFSPAANAAAKAKILTYTEQASFDFTGLGADAGNYFRTWQNERVELGPRLEFAYNWHDKNRLNGVHSSSGQTVIVGDRRYTRSGSGPWTSKALTAKQRRAYEYGLDPNVTLAKFYASPGIKRVAAGHYRVTGTYARVGSFLFYEYGMTASFFKGSNVKTFTIDLRVDRSRRPVKVTVTGRSSTWEFSITEAFAHYNKPVVIRVP
jgi:hypothetical protein